MSGTIDELKSQARRVWAEIIPANDVAALPEVMHPDYVDHSARPDEPPGIEGAAQTMRWLHSVFSDLSFDIHHVVGDGDTVAVHCTLTGRHTGDLMGIPPTGRDVATPMVHILRFRDGKAAEHWAVHNDMVTMRQLGVLPGRPVPAAG
ncbi:ester cyclase [Phytohabitans sp. LJ34]|uniref:ester cyclase n=1 Tax=Phytohabitans sp. LJ34 TaxID=3452217 RepID=UPI003F8B323B